MSIVIIRRARFFELNLVVTYYQTYHLDKLLYSR